jgi:translation initiation factor IF-2
MRNNNELFSSSVESLQINKDSVKEVAKGKECGIVIKDLNIELKPGDIIIAKELVKK